MFRVVGSLDSNYAIKFRPDTRGNVPSVSFGSEVLVFIGKYSTNFFVYADTLKGQTSTS
jgi:hypothetical protein